MISRKGGSLVLLCPDCIKGLTRLFPILLLLLIFAGKAYCQTNMGMLAGEVLDPSRAAIPNAKILVTNTSTGVTSSTVTSGAGDFRFLALVPGTYSVRAEAPGFQPETQTGVVIDVSQTTTVDLTLQVGNTTQQVTVQATNVGLETETSTIATTVTTQLLADLPLTNVGISQGGERDVLDLQFLAPGTSGNAFMGTVAGGQQFGGEVLLDGNSLNTLSGGNADVVNEVPSIEGVQEFTELTSGMSAEYGRSTNGIVNLATKSGTNSFHGSAYDIIRNTDLDANSWFNNYYMGENCSGANDSPACRSNYQTPVDKKNNYGINLGGPVWIPKVYDGRDKTFFFYNWEQVRYSNGGLNVITLPTAANRTGDFSQNLVTSNVLVPSNPCDNNNPIYQGEIFDPSTTQTINGVTCRTPFPNNVIPGGLSKVAQNMLKYLPLPNESGLADNYLNPWSSPVLATFETIRIDHSFRDADKIFGSYNTNEFAGNNGTFPIDTAAGTTPHQHFITHDINIAWDHIFSPGLENRFSAGLFRFTNQIASQSYPTNTDWPQTLGIQNLNFPGFPQVSFAQGGYFDFGYPGLYFASQNRLTINDHLSWVKGRHSFKFGYELYGEQYSTINSDSGSFAFAAAETAGISSSVTQDGNAFASFLLGQMNGASAVAHLWNPRYAAYYNAVYAQDDLRVSPTLVLNLGLRWDVDAPPHAFDNKSSMFDPNLPNPGADGRLGALAFAGNGSGLSDSWVGKAWGDFGPRIGFAWSPRSFHDKTAIRGSYDIIYGAFPSGSIIGGDQTGFTASGSYSDSNSVGGFNGTPFTLDGEFPPLATTVNTSPSQLNGQGISEVNQGTKPARVEMWNLQVQHQFAPDLILTVSYVGNHDTRLPSNLVDTNAVPQRYWALGSELTQPVVGNPYGIPVPYAGFSGSIANALRPYPQYLHIGPVEESVGQSKYEALWATLQRHYRNGLTLLFSYTWAKNTTNAGNWDAFIDQTEQNPFDISQERALSNFNIPQTLTLSYAYELPVGKGKRFLNSSRVLDAVVGGWMVGGIQRYSSGTPISFGCANQIPGVDNCVRWNFVGSNLLSDSERSGSFNPAVDNYFLNPGVTAHQVFIDPEANLATGGAYQLGSLSSYTPARGYSAAGIDEDLSIAKRFHMTEAVQAEIRVELLNAFNRHIFGVPDSNPNDLAFGNVTGMADTQRQIQLTGRIRF